VTGPFVVEPLGSSHNRRSFTCGVEPLDRYFREQVSQDIRRRLSNCFVAVDTPGEVARYYTLSATSRRFLYGGNHEVADAAALQLRCAPDDGERVRGNPRLPCSLWL